MHCHGWRNLKADRNGGATSLTVPIEGPVDGVHTGERAKRVQQLFNSYEVIDKIDLEENAMKTKGPYNPAEPKARLIEQLEKGR